MWCNIFIHGITETVHEFNSGDLLIPVFTVLIICTHQHTCPHHITLVTYSDKMLKSADAVGCNRIVTTLSSVFVSMSSEETLNVMFDASNGMEVVSMVRATPNTYSKKAHVYVRVPCETQSTVEARMTRARLVHTHAHTCTCHTHTHTCTHMYLCKVSSHMYTHIHTHAHTIPVQS